MSRLIVLLVSAMLVSGCSPTGQESDTSKLVHDVFETERAFAGTMASRDHGAFQAGFGTTAARAPSLPAGPTP